MRSSSADDCYAVESHVARGLVAVELVHYHRRRHGLHRDWIRLDTLAAQTFSARDIDGYWHYSSQIEQAARHALDGELGCYVRTDDLDDGWVRVRLIERRMHGHNLATEIVEEHRFDATAPDALVASAECAAALREHARHMNDRAEDAAATTAAEEAHTEADRADRAREARELAEILDREVDPD